MTTTPIRPAVSPPPVGLEVEVDLRPGSRVDISAPGWLFGLVLAGVTDGDGDEAIVAQVVAESGGTFRAVEGAYGRAVAMLAEWPEDENLLRTLRLLSKALRRVQRDAFFLPPG